MEPVMKAKAIKVFERKVWVESDFMGDKHVMIQHQDGKSDPFCYCSFHYDYAYTSNSTIRQTAENMAIALGATEPVEHKSRPFSVGA
ncbi:hypothetical protein [uncultured Amphritea sp.]|uniref:hypothetical protein n=1 Tax=uncultured Amphritea sp. TaxID=981605 RepID=UPI0026097054|nr:hypothetical protein [uncultured Amphritea sp.]